MIVVHYTRPFFVLGKKNSGFRRFLKISGKKSPKIDDFGLILLHKPRKNSGDFRKTQVLNTLGFAGIQESAQKKPDILYVPIKMQSITMHHNPGTYSSRI